MLALKEDTMLGNIPGDWKVKPLKGLLKEHHPGDWGADGGPNMYRVIRSTNLTNEGRLNLSDVASRALKPEKAAFLELHKNDILLERSGGGPDQPVGRVGFVKEDLPGSAFSNFLHMLRPDPEQINPNYLKWVLWRINQTGRIVRLEQQTTQLRNLHFRDYLTMPLPIPPPAEQAAIARVLDAVDTAIERTRAAVEQAEVLTNALLREAFEKLDAVPTKLSKFIVDVRYGTSQASHERGRGFPTLRIPNVSGDRLSFDDLVFVDLRPIDAERLALQNGDLLVVRSNGNPNYVGRSAVFRAPDEQVWVYASYLIRVRLDERLLPDFVNCFLGSSTGRKSVLRRVTTSAGNHNINTASIKLLTIPIPKTLAEQQIIIDIANKGRAFADSLKQKLIAQQTLKTALLQDLLTGRVRVGATKETA